MKDKRVLITGGTGVIGTYIVQALLDDGFNDIEVFSRKGRGANLKFGEDPRVTFTQGDVSELYPLSDAIKRAEYVIHAAAIVSFSPKKYEAMHQVNVDGTANVVNMAIDNDVKKFVHLSSIAALGRDEKGGVVSEETKWSNSKYNSYYGITKYLAEQEVWRAHHEGLNMSIVNPSLVYGDGLWEQSSLQIFKKVYQGLPYFPKGSTGIVDVKDVAKMILFLLKSEVSGERYIASAGNISYKDLFVTMANSMDVKAPSKSAPDWMMSVFWRLEKVRSFFSNSEPIITKETVMSTSHQSSYDNSKSRALGWGDYIELKSTIKHYSKSYVKYRNGSKL